MDNQLPKEYLPAHIGIIMDGNGRWATLRGLPRSEGHREGAKVFRAITRYAVDIGIKHLTFYAFSSENWRRPQNEVSALMSLFREYLHEAEDRKDENEFEQVRLKFIGEHDGLPNDIISMIEKAEEESSKKTSATLNLAINYGGRQEILHSVKEIAKKVAEGSLLPEDITLDDISNNLYTAGQPDPDLIIRPSGEQRLSNFLVWQSAYAEFWYSDVLWPDFTKEHLNEAIFAYAKRDRRFGGVK